MAYKNGNYTYQSKQQYLNVLGIVFTTFLVSTYFVALLKAFINTYLYFFVIGIGVLMMIHIAMKYEYAVGGLKEYKLDHL